MEIIYKDSIKKIIKDNNLNIEIKNGFIRNEYVKFKEIALVCDKAELNKLRNIIVELFIKYKSEFQALDRLFTYNIHKARRNGMIYWY